jgi:hypothetical protein
MPTFMPDCKSGQGLYRYRAGKHPSVHVQGHRLAAWTRRTKQRRVRPKTTPPSATAAKAVSLISETWVYSAKSLAPDPLPSCICAQLLRAFRYRFRAGSSAQTRPLGPNHPSAVLNLHRGSSIWSAQMLHRQMATLPMPHEAAPIISDILYGNCRSPPRQEHLSNGRCHESTKMCFQQTKRRPGWPTPSSCSFLKTALLLF